jgi:hypothetical protein
MLRWLHGSMNQARIVAFTWLSLAVSACMIGDPRQGEWDAKAGDGLSGEDFNGTDDAHGDVGRQSSRVCAQSEVTKGHRRLVLPGQHQLDGGQERRRRQSSAQTGMAPRPPV